MNWLALDLQVTVSSFFFPHLFLDLYLFLCFVSPLSLFTSPSFSPFSISVSHFLSPPFPTRRPPISLFLSSVSWHSRLPAFLQLIPGQMGGWFIVSVWAVIEISGCWCVPSRWDGALSHTAAWECCSSEEVRCSVSKDKDLSYVCVLCFVSSDR